MEEEILNVFLENDLGNTDGKAWLEVIDSVLSGEVPQKEIRSNLTFQVIKKDVTRIGDIFGETDCRILKFLRHRHSFYIC